MEGVAGPGVDGPLEEEEKGSIDGKGNDAGLLLMEVFLERNLFDRS